MFYFFFTFFLALSILSILSNLSILSTLDKQGFKKGQTKSLTQRIMNLTIFARQKGGGSSLACCAIFLRASLICDIITMFSFAIVSG